MKKRINATVAMRCFLLAVFLSSACKDETQKARTHLEDYANSLKVINTHEHQLNPLSFDYPEFNYFSLLKNSYLEFDLVSSSGIPLSDSLLKNATVEQLFDIYKDFLEYSSITSFAQQFFKGISVLYDIPFNGYDRKQIIRVSDAIKTNYRNYSAWFESSFNKAGFEIMLIDQFWPYDFDVDTSYFRLVFNTNQVVSGVTRIENEKPELLYLEDFLQSKGPGFRITSLEHYLEYLDYMFKKAKEKNALCLKNSMAYTRSIDFTEVSAQEAGKLFDKLPDISGAEKKLLEDFIYHQVINKSIEYDLPVQIHTGYLAGNGNMLENSDPLKINDLFLKYPEAKFIIFHGGYPWTSQVISLAKMFPNVYYDLVWLPQISFTAACSALDEVLDCVPYNKIMWGGDARFIEEAAGSLIYGKEVVVEVLARRVGNGSITTEKAEEILRKIFRENAIEVFDIKFSK